MGVWTKCEQFMTGRHYIVRFFKCVLQKKKKFFWGLFSAVSFSLAIGKWQESYCHIGIGYGILG